MGITYETKLPAPGVDIVRTPHVRTFIPGSGGPHLDTLLQNQITILRQNQEIRTQLALLLDDQNAVSVVPVVKKNISTEMKLMMSEGLIRAAVQVSRTYHRQRGDSVMKLIRTKTIAYTVRKWRTVLMKDDHLSEKQKSELDGLQEEHVLALHLYCAAQVRRGVQRVKWDNRDSEDEKDNNGGYYEDDDEDEDVDGDVEKASVAADGDETESVNSGYGEEERPRKRQKPGKQYVH